MAMSRNIRISSSADGRTFIYIDGKQVNGVISAKVDFKSCSIPVIKLELTAKNIDIDSDIADVDIKENENES